MKINQIIIVGCIMALQVVATQSSLANESFEAQILKRLEDMQRENSKRMEALEKENATLRNRLSRIEGTPNKAKLVNNSETQPKSKNQITKYNYDAILDANELANTRQNETASTNPNTMSYADRKFEFSASFLALQPSTTNLVYGTEVSPYPAPTPNWNDRTVTPTFTPSFNVGFRYMPSKSNDIEVNWTHLVSNTNASVGVNPAEQMIGPSWLLGSQANNYATGYGNTTFTYNAINLEGGHTFCVDCDFQFRPFVGVQIADLSQSLTGTFTNALGAHYNAYNGLNSVSNTTSSKFTGAGPRLGIGSQYNWNDFQVLGKLGAGLLIGTQQSRYTETTTCTTGCVPALTYNGSSIANNHQTYSSPNTTQVIPTLDAKVAAAYAFAPTIYGQFKLELGWQAATYFNTVSQYTLTSLCPCDIPNATTGIYLATGQHSLNNFTVQGPYVTGKWAY